MTDQPTPDEAAAEARGINVHHAMVWLYQTLLLGKNVGPPAPPVSLDPGHFHGGSPNMKLLYSVLLYIFSSSAIKGAPRGVTDHAAVHRERVRRILLRDRDCHGQAEPTSSSHGQLWLAGWGAILLVAHRTEDQELYDLAIERLSVEHAIHTVTEIEGEMWCPGGRGMMGKGTKLAVGTNATRSKMWTAIMDGRVKGRPNQFDVGAWCVKASPNEAREQIQNDALAILRRPLPNLPPMAGAFHAKRYISGDFVAFYESLEGCMDVTLSGGVLAGQRWISPATLSEEMQRAYAVRGEPVWQVEAVKGDMAGRK